MKNTSTVWVVSHVYWIGDEQGGGGFWWYTDRDSALMGYTEEKLAWSGMTARIRLVRVVLPDETSLVCDLEHCSMCVAGDTVSCWLDSHSDLLEVGWRAEKVTLPVQ